MPPPQNGPKCPQKNWIFAARLFSGGGESAFVCLFHFFLKNNGILIYLFFSFLKVTEGVGVWVAWG